MMLYLLIFLPIVAALCLYLIKHKAGKIIAFIFQILIFVGSLVLFTTVHQQGDYSIALGGWRPPLGILLEADMLSASMIVLTAFLFLVCYIMGLFEKVLDHLFVFLFVLLEALIIAVLLTRDLFNFFLVIEIATILISILIMYKKDSRSIYDGLIYLLVNVTGMTFFLFGIAILYRRFGVLDFAHLQIAITAAEPSKTVLPFAFLATGASLKCALFPVFGWLPKAHATPSAPSIVSAILSGVYVKCGIYLLIRLNIIFSATLNMRGFFLVFGIITAVTGIMLALLQKDIKLILAYSTISQIGLIIAGLFIGDETAWWGSILHIFNHALFKSVLFLTAGQIIQKYRTRNIYHIRGVWSRMPAEAIATIIGILGITGAPLFNGSISKYLLAMGVETIDNILLQAILLVVNIGTILVFIRYASIITGSKRKAIQGNRIQQATVLLMGFMCLLGGVFGLPIANSVFGLTLTLEWLAYVEKAIVFLLSLLVAWIVYRQWIQHNRFIYRGVTIELTFNAVSLSIVTLFALLLGYGWLMGGT